LRTIRIYECSGKLKVCTTWTGAISPNDPDHRPTPILIAC
jgi:hypothetical protein